MIKVVKKGIVLPFLLLLASVTLILGAFFLLDSKQRVTSQTISVSPTPTPDPTEYWMSYKNEDVMFKYPPSWSIQYVNYEKKINSELKPIKDEYPNGFNLIVGPLSVPLDKIANDPNVQKKEEYSINGYRAIRLIVIFDQSGATANQNLIIKNGKIYSLSVTTGGISASSYSDEEQFEIAKTTLNQILSTFKFTQ